MSMRNPNLKVKTKVKNIQRKKQTKVKYSFLTVVLLICLGLASNGAFINITKSINYIGKKKKMTQLKNEAYLENKRLKLELEDFNSSKSLEAIARNNLKMAGDDEVLVIINRKNKSVVNTKYKKNKAN